MSNQQENMKRSYSATTLAQLIKRKLTSYNEPVEKAQGSMESFVNVCKQRSGKNLLPNEWKTQWMVLYENKIVFFNSEYKEKAKVVIFHYTIRSVLALENRISSMSNWFEIVTKKHTYVVHAVHHRYKTEKLLYSWLVAINNSLVQSPHDCRDLESIKKVSLQIDNYNQRVSAKKRKLKCEKDKLKKKRRNFKIESLSGSEIQVGLESPRSGSDSQANNIRAFRRVKTRDTRLEQGINININIKATRPLRSGNSVRSKRRNRPDSPSTPVNKREEERLDLSESLIVDDPSESIYPHYDEPLSIPLSEKDYNATVTFVPEDSGNVKNLRKIYTSPRDRLTPKSHRDKENMSPPSSVRGDRSAGMAYHRDKENKSPPSSIERKKEKRDISPKDKFISRAKKVPMVRSLSVSTRRGNSNRRLVRQ